jgi:hypothetical protein
MQVHASIAWQPVQLAPNAVSTAKLAVAWGGPCQCTGATAWHGPPGINVNHFHKHIPAELK